MLLSLLVSYHHYIIAPQTEIREAIANRCYACYARNLFLGGPILHMESHVCRGGPPCSSFISCSRKTNDDHFLPLSPGGRIWFLQLDPEGDFVEALGKQHTSEQAAKIINDHIGDWKGPLKR